MGGMPRALAATSTSPTAAAAAKPSASSTASRASFRDALEAPEADPAHDELPSLPEEGEAGDGRLPVAPLAFSAWSGVVGAVGAAKDKPELVADSRHERADPLDPETRHAAQWAPCFEPPPAEARSTPPAEGAAARASLESLLPELVDKVAWSCDRRRGSMRLELRAGALAGAASSSMQTRERSESRSGRHPVPTSKSGALSSTPDSCSGESTSSISASSDPIRRRRRCLALRSFASRRSEGASRRTRGDVWSSC